MKALRKLGHDAGLIEVQEVPKPEPKPGEVLLQVKLAGVCFTDIHIWHGEFPKLKPPVTLCHECCGVVAELGDGVEGWRPGDRVTTESEAFTCGECRFCRAGLNQLCDQRTALGYATDGAFAQFMRVRASALHRLPDNVSFTAGAVSEPLAVGVHAVMEIGRIQPDEWVLVTGPGTIGLITMQVARALGAKVAITGTAQDASRLELAARLGAEHCIQVESGDQFKLAAELNEGLWLRLGGGMLRQPLRPGRRHQMRAQGGADRSAGPGRQGRDAQPRRPHPEGNHPTGQLRPQQLLLAKGHGSVGHRED